MSHWVLFSITALLGIVIFNLSLQWGLNLKLAQEKLLLYIFSASFVFFLILDKNNLSPLIVSGKIMPLLGWGFMIALLSVSLNYLTLTAYKIAPNPGYVEGIKAINGIFSTFIGLLLFSVPIHPVKWFGILIIPLGLWFFKEKSDAKGRGLWRILAIFIALLIAAMFTLWGYLSNSLGYSPADILMVLFLFASIIFLIISIVHRTPWRAPKIILIPIFLAIAFSIPANYSNIAAIKAFGSPGPPTSVYNAQAILTAIFANRVFSKDQGGELDLKRFGAIIIVLIGALFIIFSPK